MGLLLLYAIWVMIPMGYGALTLWSFLDSLQKGRKRTDSGDLAKQTLFVSCAVALAFVVDRYFLDDIIDHVLPFAVSKGLLQALLLPFILLITARLWGGSKEIKISKAPPLSQRSRHR